MKEILKIVESESEEKTLLKLTFCKVVCDCPFNGKSKSEVKQTVKLKIVESESGEKTLLKLKFCKVVCDCPFNITNVSLGSRK